MNSSFLDYKYRTTENKIFANFYRIGGESEWAYNDVGYADILFIRDFDV